jgi:hypothetical protein
MRDPDAARNREHCTELVDGGHAGIDRKIETTRLRIRRIVAWWLGFRRRQSPRWRF